MRGNIEISVLISNVDRLSVVVHDDSHPSSGCTGWGPMFAADNMRVTHLDPNPVAEEGIPSAFALDQNSPNPFHQTTMIRYRLEAYGRDTIRILDMLGMDAATLADEIEEPHYRTVIFDGNVTAGGVYHYQRQAGSYRELKKLVLVR